MKNEQSYEEFKEAVRESLVNKTFANLSEEEQKKWEQKVSGIEQDDFERICKEAFENPNGSVESCAWCLHFFA